MSEELDQAINEEQEEIPDLMLAKQQVEEMRLKLAEYEDTAKRARAEAENIRKRMEKEKREMVRYANKNLLARFIDFVDDFERALQTKPEDAGEQFYKGVEMMYKQLTTFLETNGVRAIEALGAEFDPNIHQAIAVEEGDYRHEVVVEVFQKGYMMYDELLRAAVVKIGKPKNASAYERTSEPLSDTVIEADPEAEDQTEEA